MVIPSSYALVGRIIHINWSECTMLLLFFFFFFFKLPPVGEAPEVKKIAGFHGLTVKCKCGVN